MQQYLVQLRSNISPRGYCLFAFLLACLFFLVPSSLAVERTEALPSNPEEAVEVLMKTSAGDIRLRLFPRLAPKTVSNFLAYVAGGYYNGGSFYRVVRADNQVQNPVKISVIQGGMGMPQERERLPPISHESTLQSGVLHRDGVISLARGAPGTGQSEFFICVDDQPELDFGGQRNPDGQGFAAFGLVVTGMAVVRAIQNRATAPADLSKLEYTSGQILLPPVLIQSVMRLN